MKKGYKLDFQKIRRKTQIKDFISFELYLKNIFSDIAKPEWKEKEQKGINKLSFIEYMNIPFIVGEKLFKALDKSKKGFLTKNEFVNGIISLYVGDLEETQKMIFSILDFDSDGIIIPQDSRLLISFIKNLSGAPSTVIKQKLQKRNTISDEENLNEINELINNFFNNKPQMSFEEYKYNIENVNSDVFFVFIYFLYDTKPFSESAIKILKLQNSISNNMTSSFSSSMNSSSEDCIADSSKFQVKSPSKVFKRFISDLVDVDVDEIERECGREENIQEYSTLPNKKLIEIEIPEFNSKLKITEKKSEKDFPSKANTSERINNILFDSSKRNINANNPDFESKNKIKSSNILNCTDSSEKNSSIFNFNNTTTNKSILSSNKDLKKVFLVEKSEKEINFNNNSQSTYDHNSNIFIDGPVSINDSSNLRVINDTNKKKFNITINNNMNIESIALNKFTVGNKKEFKNEENFGIKESDILNTRNSSCFLISDDYQNKSNIRVNNINESNNNPNLFDNINNLNLSKQDSGSFFKSSKLNSSNNLGFESLRNTNTNMQSADDFINPSDIIYEGYIFKSRSNLKLKKYYLILIGMDLFYFSNSKKTKLKGMHNLSGSYAYEEGDLIKVHEAPKSNGTKEKTSGSSETQQSNVVKYYPFKLCFKKKTRFYFCSIEEDCKKWVKFIRSVTKFREVNDLFSFGESLGKGKFGNVTIGINKSNKTQVAIKTINKVNLKGIETEMVKTEIEIMRFCRHRNIVHLLDNFEDLENIYIIIEYLSGGNLNTFLSQQKTILEEQKIKEIIYQIGSGVKYLHHFGILHRDLKPENLMMSEKNHKIAIVKIVDFGLSKILGVTEKSNDTYGTLSYAAPEVITNNDYNNTVDIWSMGVILFFLICGYLPFNDKNNNIKKIARDITKARVKFDDDIWENFSPYALELTKKCLEKELNNRINIKEFLEHDWFKEN